MNHCLLHTILDSFLYHRLFLKKEFRFNIFYFFVQSHPIKVRLLFSSLVLDDRDITLNRCKMSCCYSLSLQASKVFSAKREKNWVFNARALALSKILFVSLTSSTNEHNSNNFHLKSFVDVTLQLCRALSLVEIKAKSLKVALLFLSHAEKLSYHICDKCARALLADF